MKPTEPLISPLSPVARLAASRQQLRAALHPATPPGWVAQAQTLWRPSMQRHPVRWVLGALVAGGLGAALWRHIPRTWLSRFKQTLTTTLGTVGQEALLSWWLSVLQAHQQGGQDTAQQPQPEPQSTAPPPPP